MSRSHISSHIGNPALRAHILAAGDAAALIRPRMSMAGTWLVHAK
jgi:hypothetical protein